MRVCDEVWVEGGIADLECHEILRRGQEDIAWKMAQAQDWLAEAKALAARASELCAAITEARGADEEAVLAGVTTPYGRVDAVGGVELRVAPDEAPMIKLGTDVAGRPFLFPSTSNAIFSGDADASERALKALLTRLLYSREPASLRPRFFDPTDQGYRVGPFNPLLSVEQLGGSRVACSSRDIEETVGLLKSRVQQVNQQALKGRYGTLTEFNQSERSQHYMVAVAFGLSAAWTPQQVQELAHLAEMGPRAGVNVLAALLEDYPNDGLQKKAFARLCSAPETFHFKDCSVEGAKISATLDGTPLVLDGVDDQQSLHVRSQMDLIAEWGERNLVPSVDASQMAASRGDGSSIHGLDIPVGIDAESVISLKFDDDTPHGLVIGQTGSGKSVLLSTLVYAAAQKYSPDELELWLVDLKEGNEFKDFVDLPADPGLPQARVVAASSDELFAVRVLDALAEEVSARGAMLREVPGVKDLAGYREKTGKTIPRVLAIIDEAFVILGRVDKQGDLAWKALERISKQGRYVGVHTFLANHSLAGLGTQSGTRKSVWNQYPLRIALKCSPNEAELIFDIHNKSAFGLAGKGQAVVNWNQGLRGHDTQIQVAMFSDDDMRMMRTQISQRWRRPVPQAAFVGDALARWTPLPGSNSPRFAVGRPMSLESHAIIDLDLVQTVALIGPPASTLPLLVAAAIDLQAHGAGDSMIVVHPDTVTSRESAETLQRSVQCRSLDEQQLTDLLDAEQPLPDVILCLDVAGFPRRMPSHKTNDEVWSRLLSKAKEVHKIVLVCWPSETVAKERMGSSASYQQAFPIRISAGTGSLGALRGQISGDAELTPYGSARSFIPWAMPTKDEEVLREAEDHG